MWWRRGGGGGRREGEGRGRIGALRATPVLLVGAMVDEELRSARLGGSRRLSCGVDFLTLHIFQVESCNANFHRFHREL